jgi:uncharacterized protein (TIGR00369 family)
MAKKKSSLPNYCFACGKDNPDGMHLKFAPNKAGDGYLCRFKLDNRYAGPPGHCHGGIIATILDDAMGKINKLSGVTAVTSKMTVHYLRPVPLNKPLRVQSRGVAVEGRAHLSEAAILNSRDEVLARSEGTFIAIDPEKMFKKFLPTAAAAKSKKARRM